MRLLSGGQSNFFGLDLGTTSLRAVQLKGKGALKTLQKYAMSPADGNILISDSEADQAKVVKSIGDVLSKAGITAKNVAVNIPSGEVFNSVIELDRMPNDELAKTIRYQAESFIPTPIAESKVDWALLGDSPSNPKKVEVLLSSVPNKYVETRLKLLEAAGLNVIAFEPDSLALMRAIVPADAAAPQMVLDIGRGATDLIIVMNGNPHLSRAIAVGTASLIKAATQNLNIPAEQAEQFVYKFGLGKDKLEGQIYNAIIQTVEALMTEVEKSIQYFTNRYPSTKLERIIVTGGASSVPELPLYVANRFGIAVEVGNAWRNVSYPPARQDELLAVSNHFGVAVGLAERL